MAVGALCAPAQAAPAGSGGIVPGTDIIMAAPGSGGSVLAPLQGPALFGTPGSAQPGNGATRYDGLDEKWGKPLNMDLIEAGPVHAGLNYYYDAGRFGGQGGFGFHLTVKN